MTRLWVDDLRIPPEEGWNWMVSSGGAIAQLHLWCNYGVPVEELSLDYDLGGDDTTMPIVDWMREHNCWPDVINVHSMNPIGRENLLRAINHDAPPEVDIYFKIY